MDTIKGFIKKLLCIFLGYNTANRLLCIFFGHKKSRIILAYSINEYATYLRVEVYELSVCSRCGCIPVNRIDWYQICNWYTGRRDKEEEDKLRKQGLVTLAEAYKELRV